MENLKKERSIARSVFTKCKNKFVENFETEKDNQTKIRSCFEILSEKAQSLFSIEDKVQIQWLTQDDYAEEIVVDDHDAAYEYKLEFYQLKDKYEAFIERERSKPPPESHYDSVSVSHNRKRNLPKLELTKFDGDPKNWLGFWSSFKKIHTDESTDDDDKMGFLNQCMVADSPAQDLVKSFPPCGENYAQAIQQLKMRYGRDELLIEIYVRELLSLVLNQAKETTAMPISSLYDKLKTQLRALVVLGVTSDKYAAMLYPLVESALPEELLRVWERQRSRGNSEDILNSLLEFVKVEVESEERIKLARMSLRTNEAQEEAKVPTAACLVAGGDSKKSMISKQPKKPTPSCIFCDKPNHTSLECTAAQKMTVEQRRDIAANKRACFLCLKIGHRGSGCRPDGKCICCQKKHTVILCPDVGKQNEPNENGATSSDNTEASLASGSNRTTLLQTLIVRIGNEKVRAFIDTGAQRSYLKKDVAMKLGLKSNREEVLRHYLFGGIETKDECHQVYDLMVKSMNGEDTLSMIALSKEKICGYIPRIKDDGAVIQKLKVHKLTLSDVGDSTPEVGLLIGADYAGKIMTGKVIHLNEDLHAIQTLLGWTLQGIVAGQNKSIIATVDLYDRDISKLWDLEVIGIEDPKDRLLKNRTQEEAIETFRESVTINDDGRYEVTLPWKIDRPELLDNRKLAEKRLESTTKRLESLNELQNYGKVFEEWMELGIIEVDPDVTSPGHYLSHHAVIKESSLTTRVRPVFDASARDFNGNSINSCLEKGQNFLELIPILLTKFRMNMIGVTSDIKKAFLQISIAEDDRKYLRFLWWSKEKEIIVYRHCRVVFGLTCSPFLLGATLIHHLEKYSLSQYSKSAELLKNSLYVDNCVASLDSQLETDKFIEEAKTMMYEGKFELRGWVTAPVQCKDTEKQPTISVLGMNWDTTNDVLRCNINAMKECKEPISRRELLSICNRIFDPIGFTNPTTLIPKLLLQKTWSLKVDWDTALPEEMNDEFKTWLEDVHWLKECSIPRRLTEKPIQEGKISLHVFSDASKYAYATCIFLRSETDNNEVSVQLVLAKSRVTPVKAITIPRLELIAAVMSTRLYAQVCEALQLENFKTYFWSDSSVVVTWIVTDKEWSVFVRNRVREIRETTRREDWRHINGTNNPADLPSRGCSAKKLVESRWWEGPTWLTESEDKWPTSETVVREEDVNQELKKTERIVNNTDIVPECFTTCLKNMSKYSKIVRTIAWIWRFYRNCKRTSEKVRGDITFEETEHAERTLLRVVQQESFNHGKLRGIKNLEKYEDENGLLRVKTRLTLSEESECFKTPILLNGKHKIVERLVEQRHRQYLHAGVNILFSTLRNNYWILGGKKLAKRIISKCMICKRFRVGHYKTPTAPLPENRVKNTGVFQVTGIDAAGPLILNSKEKCWFILFTCAVYRAVHIELVMSMSTECFLMALRRFIARRGRVQIIYSDNGTNFVGAENLLAHVNWDVIQEHSTIVYKIKWVFNPPATPWWGGWWERIIRILKELLRRNLGAASLSFVELETVLCDIEAVVNARPLTYLAEDDTLRPLTPETFLHPLQGTEVADLDAVDAESLNARQKYLQKLRADLRQRFRNEYLALLVSKTQESNDPVQIGDVVIIETDAKRISWPLGLVEDIYMGKDGQHRVAKVKTAGGYRIRAVQRLYPLEVKRDEELSEMPTEEVPALPTPEVDLPAQPRTSRSGRPVKVPRRLDL